VDLRWLKAPDIENYYTIYFVVAKPYFDGCINFVLKPIVKGGQRTQWSRSPCWKVSRRRERSSREIGLEENRLKIPHHQVVHQPPSFASLEQFFSKNPDNEEKRSLPEGFPWIENTFVNWGKIASLRRRLLSRVLTGRVQAHIGREQQGNFRPRGKQGAWLRER